MVAALLSLTLTVETDAVWDAATELESISRALARRHGPAFRALDRRIDALMEGDFSGCFSIHDLEPLHSVAVPSGELAAVLNEARLLRVLSGP